MDDVLELGAETTDVELGAGENEGAGAGEQTDATGEQQTTQQTDTGNAATTWKQVKDRLKDAPDLHRQVKKALHFMEDANKRLPDGIAKVSERLALIAQFDDNPSDLDYVAGATPIEEVISNTLAERTFWREYDNAFQAGDGKVINQMIEANPESFQKLIPQAMDRFSEINPEGFSAYVCKSVSGYLNQAQIPLQLALLERVLPAESNDPALQTVIDAFKHISGVFEQINTTAKNPIQPKSVQQQLQTQNPGANGTSIEQREMNVLHDEWLRDIRPRSESFTVAEVQKVAPNQKFSEAEVSTIRKAVREEINARVSANSGYQGKVKAFLKAKNKTAYSMTVESEHKKIIPGAVKRAVDDVLAKRKTSATAKTTKAAQTQQNGKQGAVQQPANSKFENIAQSPTRLGLKVDFRKTSNEMLARNEAYVAGRTNPVKWKR